MQALEEMLRGACSFYIDLLIALEGSEEKEADVTEHYAHEAINLAGAELALRKIDNFRKKHLAKIKDL